MSATSLMRFEARGADRFHMHLQRVASQDDTISTKFFKVFTLNPPLLVINKPFLKSTFFFPKSP